MDVLVVQLCGVRFVRVVSMFRIEGGVSPQRLSWQQPAKVPRTIRPKH